MNSPRWLIGIGFLFIICSLISATIEKQDIIASGSTEQTVIEEALSFTKVDMTDIFGNPTAIVQATGDTLGGIWRMLMWDYSFFKASDDNANTLGVIAKYFFLMITLGLMFSLAITIGGMIRGSGT